MPIRHILRIALGSLAGLVVGLGGFSSEFNLSSAGITIKTVEPAANVTISCDFEIARLVGGASRSRICVLRREIRCSISPKGSENLDD
jgi:hypothetical protein